MRSTRFWGLALSSLVLLVVPFIDIPDPTGVRAMQAQKRWVEVPTNLQRAHSVDLFVRPGKDGLGSRVMINLITNTIEPKTWTGAGGPSTIHYDKTKKLLWIRTSEDVHNQIADLLQALSECIHKRS